MSAEATTAAIPSAAAVTAGLTQPAPSSLPAGYVETDAAQCGQAKVAHLLGIFGILGTGIYYLVKRNDAAVGPFVRDQMKEAFNFHLLVFAGTFVLNIIGAIAGAVATALALVFSLVVLALVVGAIVLSVMNAMKAGKGQVARYPARLRALK
jgi:uncharacterized Tic20 family protein